MAFCIKISKIKHTREEKKKQSLRIITKEKNATVLSSVKLIFKNKNFVKRESNLHIINKSIEDVGFFMIEKSVEILIILNMSSRQT
jgi:ribosomal protein L36